MSRNYKNVETEFFPVNDIKNNMNVLIPKILGTKNVIRDFKKIKNDDRSM